jgi:hypothetical protein
LDPLGWEIARRAEKEEGMIVADLKADLLIQARGQGMGYFLPHRRPELYGKVSAPRAAEPSSRKA